ncbi:NAD(P)-dependent oxidoreductase [Pseudoxanthomonas sp. z9]|uniref:NAD-dependent epimerase/dehydratase family protein n=1 Tax=Pseudoxanthomonas sp. z9 TaxID=2584942 RepID=UPI001144FC7C|nr:NAD(P)-dependent oxidoreductase [Pseudoxanthomonas sp. z9]
MYGKVLVTGSSGHLGEALVTTLQARGHAVVGVDLLAGAYTHRVGTIADRAFVREAMAGVEVVLHPATLHKPHVATHSRQEFIDTNLTGTLNLLEEAVAGGVRAFVYTSTTSVFGDALVPPPGEPAAWIAEDVRPEPKNIYGVTKAAAEDLCQLFQRNQKLACIVLRTSRFFAEEDDDRRARESFSDANLKANEFLYRRVDIEDVVDAHLRAIERAPMLGFGRYIVSATTPFAREDMARLRADMAGVLRDRVPGFEAEYTRRGWLLPAGIDRVYVNARAREDLGWRPRHDFADVLARLRSGGTVLSPLAGRIGAKGYHAESFADGPYPVESH